MTSLLRLWPLDSARVIPRQPRSGIWFSLYRFNIIEMRTFTQCLRLTSGWGLKNLKPSGKPTVNSKELLAQIQTLSLGPQKIAVLIC